jgi:hypothetical protein
MEKLLAILAEEEMMMLSGSTFIVRLRARNLDVPRLAFVDQLPQRPVNGGNAQPFHLLASLLANLVRGQRAGGGFDDPPNGAFLTGLVSHDLRCLDYFRESSIKS